MSTLQYTRPLAVEFKADAEQGVISGYAATWDLDLGDDRFKPGAFKSVVAEQFPRGQVKVYREHNVAVGLPLTMREDARGLYVEAKIERGDSKDGDETLNLARRGVYDAFSVAYVVDPATVTYVAEKGRRVRTIGTVARMPHFGILDDPMNPAAVITGVKGGLALPEEKSLYNLAEVMEHYFDIQWILRYSSLTEEEAVLAREVVDRMRQMGAAWEQRLAAEQAVMDAMDSSIPDPLMEAAKSLSDQAGTLRLAAYSAPLHAAIQEFRTASQHH